MISFRSRELLYKKIGKYFPGMWKLTRLVLFGKLDFNDVQEWENSYTDITEEEIEKLQNRIPNLVNEAVRITGFSQAKSVLDVGAGFGNYILKLPEHVDRQATEFSNAAIAYLESKGIATKKAILPDLPYPDETIDLLTSISVFEHLRGPRIIRRSFESFHRVCRKGVIFSVPFESLYPWRLLIHNYNFTKSDIERFTSGLFEVTNWAVIQDGTSTRCICYLVKK